MAALAVELRYAAWDDITSRKVDDIELMAPVFEAAAAEWERLPGDLKRALLVAAGRLDHLKAVDEMEQSIRLTEVKNFILAGHWGTLQKLVQQRDKTITLRLQDIAKISDLATGRVVPFDAVKMMEVVNAQHVSDRPGDLFFRAASLFRRMVELRPFFDTNPIIGFLSALIFIRVNSYRINLEPNGSPRVLSQIMGQNIIEAAATLHSLATPGSAPPTISETIEEVVKRYRADLDRCRESENGAGQ